VAKGQPIGSKYLELPSIIDKDEEKKRRLARKRKNNKAQTPLALDEDKDMVHSHSQGSELAMLRKYCNIPQTWADTKFMKGREGWISDSSQKGGYELENHLKTSAFETYLLERGHVYFNYFGRRKDTTKLAGYLRAVVRVTTSNPRFDDEYNQFFKTLKSQATKCVVRLYVIKGQNLQPLDSSGFSDPYLSLQLGDKIINDRANKHSQTLNPDFFRRFEFHTVLPGPSNLKIQVWDADFFTSDSLIGETTVDLEERWFHPKWVEFPVNLKPIEVSLRLDVCPGLGSGLGSGLDLGPGLGSGLDSGLDSGLGLGLELPDS
jgi:hypothetical protein